MEMVNAEVHQLDVFLTLSVHTVSSTLLAFVGQCGALSCTLGQGPMGASLSQNQQNRQSKSIA